MLWLALRSVPLVALAALALAASGCGLLRSAPSPAERLAATARRLDAAPTDSSRAAVAVALFEEAGLTPLAGDRFVYGPAHVVGGFVPGRAPGARDTLVVVAASIGGDDAAVVIEAARLLADAADRAGADPGRSVLVALWGSGLRQTEGLQNVLSFPFWPRGAVRQILVVGDPPGVVSAFGVPAEVVSSGPDGPLTPERVAARVVAGATATAAYGMSASPAAPANSAQTSPSRN